MITREQYRQRLAAILNQAATLTAEMDPSRERALVITKLDEAELWATRVVEKAS